MSAAYDHYVVAFLRGAEARLDCKIAALWLRLDTAWRCEGMSEAEIAERAAVFEEEARKARTDALYEIGGMVNEANLKRDGSTVAVAQQSGMRH